jgi:polyhydroxyalkanoate synthesis regulator phasin
VSIDPLAQLTEQLRQAAAELRAGELEPEQAARVVEECARIAGDAANELERRIRTAADGAPGASA